MLRMGPNSYDNNDMQEDFQNEATCSFVLNIKPSQDFKEKY